jgi:hypothetical protein
MNKIKALIFSAILTFTGLAVMPASVGAAGSASLSLSPAGGSRTVGSTFAVSVIESSGATAVNGVQADLSYSSALQLIGKGCGGAFEIAAPAGGASIACATVSPKTGTQSVGTVSFKVVAAGSASVSILPSSQITASDGQGSNVYNGASSSAGYSLVAPAPRPVAAPVETTPAPAPKVETKKVETKPVVAKPVAKKSKTARVVWSIVFLAAVLLAALVILVEPVRKRVSAVASTIAKKISSHKVVSALAVATVSKSKTIKKSIKRSK